jgi:hypothetical protein
MKVKAGQKIIIEEISYSHRRDGQIYNVTVERVGRKYFYVSHHDDILKFDLTSGEYDKYGIKKYQAYTSQEEYQNQKRIEELSSRLANYFSSKYNWIKIFTLEDLEYIYNIVGTKIGGWKY